MALQQQQQQEQEQVSVHVQQRQHTKLPAKRITLIKKRKISPDAQPLLDNDGSATPTSLDANGTVKTETQEQKRAKMTPLYQGCLWQLIPEDWRNALRDEGVLESGVVEGIERQFYAEVTEAQRKVFPKREEIFNALRLCSLAKVRVVIIGQDPYIYEGQSMGLAFSVRRGVRVPPSLENIYKELAKEYTGFDVPTHGDLSAWAEQGVLLLNSVLTVREKEPTSHFGWGWQQFTDAIIDLVCKRHEHVVFLLWGSYARNKASRIQGHYKLRAAHPSPKSAENGFFDCGHFVECNHLLARHEKAPIEWGTQCNGEPLPRPQQQQQSIMGFVRVRKRPVEPSGATPAVDVKQ